MGDGARVRRLVTEWEFLVSTLQPPTSNPAEQLMDRVGVGIGVTVLAGFLGSGKTTMLRHLLQGSHGLKLAAVVNDVGAVNIDAALVAQSSEDVVELTNGCSCCALGADLGRALETFATQPEPSDGIIIEASGIADPAGIATVVASGGLRLDGVVSVVDAAAMDTWIGNPATADLFQRQLDAAHLIVLNKADLIDDTGQRAAMDRLGTMAPGRPVILTEQGRLDPEVALGAALRGARSDPGVAAHEANRFATKTIPLDGPIDRHAFAIFLGNPPAGLLRMKGFVETIEAPGQLWLVQSVGRLWSIEPVKSAPGAISPLPGLVMIGIAGTEQAWQPFAKV